MIDSRKLKAELALRGLTMWKAAKELGLAASTFSGYVSGARPAPPDFARKVEKLLKVRAGALEER